MCDVLSTHVFVQNLLNALLVLFTGIVSFSYNSSGPSDYWHEKAFHITLTYLLTYFTYSMVQDIV
jgi:hypothetical protein